VKHSTLRERRGGGQGKTGDGLGLREGAGGGYPAGMDTNNASVFAGYRCRRCGAAQAPDFKGAACPVCGENLEVECRWPEPSGEGWRDGAFGDGVLRYHRLLPVSDLSLASPLRVGGTPLYRPERLAAAMGLDALWLKDEGLNPSGSFKDRASAVALIRARETGAKVICGASTGNAGSSMACLAASVGMPCVIFVPEKAPPAKIAQLLVFGAQVFAVRGTYDDAFDLCTAVCERRGWFSRNTGYNPFTREGKKTVAFELFEQLGGIPDWVVVPTGDGNIISGTWKGFRDLVAAGVADRTPKMLCAQSAQSAAIATAVREAGTAPDWRNLEIPEVRATTVADSISVDIPRDGFSAVRAVVESGGAAVTVDDADILAAIPEVARKAGVFIEPAAACACAGLKAAVRQGIVRRDERVVVLCTGNGLKDVASARRVAGDPVPVDPTPEAALAATAHLG